MIVSPELEPEAREELLEALSWYADQHPLLGVELLDEIEAALQDIAERPQSWPRRTDVPDELEVRHRQLQRFPYSVVYRVDPKGPRVLAIAHHKRKPGYFQRRVRPGH
jgi:toxin ParE1/3/4